MISKRHVIELRGKEWDVVVDFDGGYEPDTNVHVIEWHFDGFTPDQHERLNLTDEEEQYVYDQLVEQRR